MGYREQSPPPELAALVECSWTRTGRVEPGRVLPDGCMDLIRSGDQTIVAGPDTTAYLAAGSPHPIQGLRFRPGVLPRLLDVPAAEVQNIRVPLHDLRTVRRDRSLYELTADLASGRPGTTTAPWSLPTLREVTNRLADGAAVGDIAHATGWSTRTLQRQCAAVYGYGPAMLRRVLRFRRAVRLLSAGLPAADVAAQAGYADQPHLHREVRNLAGVPLRQLASGAYRSTDVPSGSSTVA